MTEVIRKDRTSSLRCRPVRSALQARAGRPLPNSCPCASYSGWLGQSCGGGLAAAGFLRMPLLASRVARNRRFYAHLTALLEEFHLFATVLEWPSSGGATRLLSAATPRITLFAGKAVEVQDDDRPLRQHRLDT